MNLLLKELEKSLKFNDFIKNIENKKSPIAISGLCDFSIVSTISYILENLKRPIMLITYNEIQAQKLVSDFKFFTDKVVFLPKKEIVTYDYIAESKNLPYERIDVLNKIYKEQNLIIVTSVETILQKIISKDSLYKNVLNFKVGQQCDLEKVKQKLVDLGYERFELIDGRGEFSIRGGIIDISISDTQGVRVELWGDEIDSIRYFNIISQRSTENIDKIEIFPAHEYILENSIDDVIKNIRENIYHENLVEKVENDIEQIKNGNYISKIDKYFNCFYKNQNTILEYLSNKYLVFVDEINKIYGRIENVEINNENTIKALIEKERIVLDVLKCYLNKEDVEVKLNKNQTVYLDKLDNIYKNSIEKYNFNCKEINYYKSGIDLFINDIKNFQKENKKIYIIVETKEKADKIQKLLEENEIMYIFQKSMDQTIVNSRYFSSCNYTWKNFWRIF